ncbi:InlB B-repeat-containing protein, partial [Candidatus Collinsella stercoripullorum]|uniref:InlB B-repeat-containing protein n=1 Tax=Candidatus Collinsella stercoripullorum TaxID=2838522 RepID=UPI0022E4CF83
MFYTVDGADTDVAADESGTYTIPAEVVNDGLAITVETAEIPAADEPAADDTAGESLAADAATALIDTRAIGIGTPDSPYVLSVNERLDADAIGWSNEGRDHRYVSSQNQLVSVDQDGNVTGLSPTTDTVEVTHTYTYWDWDWFQHRTDTEEKYFKVSEPASYSLTYHANNGTDDQRNETVSGPVGSVTATILTNPFTYDGHRFIGWATSPDSTEPEYSAGEEISVTSDMDLYAMWSEIAPSISVVPYAVRIMRDGQTQLQVNVYPEESDVLWSSENEAVASVDQDGVVHGVKAGTTTIYASANGLTATAQITVVDNMDIQTAYFYGVKPDADPDDTGNDSFFYVGEGTIDVSGLRKGTDYGDYKANGDWGPWGTVRDASMVVTAPSEETIKQRIFDEYKDEYGLSSPDDVKISWTYHKETYTIGAPDEDGTDIVNGAACWHVDMNVTINTPERASAQYMVQQPGDTDFTVTEQYVLDLGTSTSPQKSYETTKTFGGRTYDFVGWFTNRECTEEAQFPYTIEEATTFYAKYVPVDTYNVTYDGNGNDDGTVPIDSDDYETGDTVTVKNQRPAKSGYTFEGWEYNGQTYKAGDTFTMPSKDVVLTAQWEINPAEWNDVIYL